MIQLGFKLCSEEHRPNDLVRFAKLAEDAGFGFAMISDHYHPWTDRQGQSPFVWSVLGGIAQVTKRLRLGTAVTCPTMRVHPAIVAQAAATAADMLEGRFLLGVGSGERLNEHIVGKGWPEPEIRHAMLSEAIALIRALWKGDLVNHHGPHFAVERARLYTLPATPPPIYVAGDHPYSARLSGRLGDGLISFMGKKEMVDIFEAQGGRGKPKLTEIPVCWAADEAKAKRTAHARWPIAGMPSQLLAELALPQHFEATAALVTEETIGKLVTCGPDPEKHMAAIRECAQAGYDHVFVHQVGPDQEGFLRFYARAIVPRLGELRAAA